MAKPNMAKPRMEQPWAQVLAIEWQLMELCLFTMWGQRHRGGKFVFSKKKTKKEDIILLEVLPFYGHIQVYPCTTSLGWEL